MTDETRTTAAERASAEPPPRSVTPQDRVLLLDMWQRSGLTARDFGALVGVNKATLFAWKTRFERSGPAGLSDKPRGAPPGSRLTEPTQRAILMLKQAHPEWGCERIRDVLLRGEGYSASPGAIAHLLRENGYELEAVETSPHPPAVQHFERARPNQLWQSDLFTFLLKRENRRVYLVVYLDDHSRFIVGYGVWASAGGALVREVLEAAIANFGAPDEVLTDNGPQYVTWRGTSAFAKLLERRGIRHLVARPRRPQTLGKTERFWGTLWRECVEGGIFLGLDDARRRIGHFIDHYNFQRPHGGRADARGGGGTMTANARPPLTGDARAKQRAAIILAVLSGDCPVAEANRRLGVTAATYYALEQRALQGLVRALDGTKAQRRTAAICKQHVQLEHEVLRLQALVRATQRAAGLPPPPKSEKRRRRSAPRARKVIAQLRAAEPPPAEQE